MSGSTIYYETTVNPDTRTVVAVSRAYAADGAASHLAGSVASFMDAGCVR